MFKLLVRAIEFAIFSAELKVGRHLTRCNHEAYLLRLTNYQHQPQPQSEPV
jgi:hypothetical protein